jgi:non-specific serine/threonine protein kinase
LKAARGIVGNFPDGGWIVELASLSDPARVPSAVAAVLGLKLSGEDISATAVAQAIDGQGLLLLLDNCEHVIDAVADLAETLVRQCPRTTIMTTSRETLRIEGEHAYRIPPLEVPASTEEDPGRILGHSAVELFVARGRARDSDFLSSAAHLPLVATICRRLDGIPLAIEFAAARAAVLGIQGVADGLHDRFAMLTSGRRMALPRHRTLRATLDWSYALLPEQEQWLLRRLGVFAGGFTMESAAVVAGTEPVSDGIANLVTKSLVILQGSGRWDQLETIRAYALEQLAANGELAEVKRLHAEAMTWLFRHADTELAAGVTDEWRRKYEPEIGNLRAALDWAFGPDGDAALGVALAALSTNVWIALSLLGECCDWAARALSRLGPATGTHEEIVLQAGYGLALSFARGVTPVAHQALTRALALAEAASDLASQLRPLFGLWLHNVRATQFHGSLDMALRLEAISVATSDGVIAAASNALGGISRFCLGNYSQAMENFIRVPSLYPLAQRNNDATRFGVDFRSVSRSYHAATLWVQGFPEQAALAAREAIEEARMIDRPLSLCLILAITVSTVLIRVGDFQQADGCIDELIRHARACSLPPFAAVGLCARGSLMAARGDAAAANQLLESGIAALNRASIYFYYPLFAAERAAALGALGRVQDGLAEIGAAQRQAEASSAFWCMERILRIKGGLLAALGGRSDAEAEQAFVESLDLARRGKALSLELRAAISLARFWRDRDRTADARMLLDRVYGQFTEGFDTADLIAARALRAQLD